MCGSISNYNASEPYNVKNLQLLVWREVRASGFIVASLAPKHADTFFTTMPGRVARGEVRYRENVSRGLASAARAIEDVQRGRNFGKSVVIVADE